MTWLYAVGAELPSLRWGRARGRARLDSGCASHEDRERRRSLGTLATELLSVKQRAATPPAFRDLLLDMARSVRATEAA
jgi:hypothetical protein